MNNSKYWLRKERAYTILIVVIAFTLLISFSGCKSIHVGGSGQIGGVSGGGGVTIPVPPQIK